MEQKRKHNRDWVQQKLSEGKEVFCYFTKRESQKWVAIMTICDRDRLSDRETILFEDIREALHIEGVTYHDASFAAMAEDVVEGELRKGPRWQM